MNSQNTPVHIKLWHKDFWLMAVSNMLLTMSVYMLLPAMPLWMYGNGFSDMTVGCAMGAFGLGVFVLGPFSSFLVQKYRRNRVCMMAITAIILCLFLLYYTRNHTTVTLNVSMAVILRFVLGAFFGLAQMILASTLIIDTSESFQRTEANYAATWFARFALSLGPMLSLILYRFFHYNGVLVGATVCAATAIILIRMVDFPFRTPSDNIKIFSLDRFFLPQGFWLFLNFVMITTVVGLLLTVQLSYVFYGMMMVGFFIAVMSQRFVFANAELKSEVITGLILMGTALLLMLTRRQMIVFYLSPFFIGLGIGIIGSRFLLFFIKLSKHCQRGTSQSTYILAWESGLALGLFLGFAFLAENTHLLLVIGIILIVLSLIIYNFFVHAWYVKHKNR